MNRSLGQKLKQLREKKELTQKEASDRIGCTFNMLSNYELDKREPNIGTLKSIAIFYNVSIDYLVGISETPNPLTLDTAEKQQEREEKQLIQMYRKLSDRQKGNIEGQIKAMMENQEMQESKDQITATKDKISKKAI